MNPARTISVAMLMVCSACVSGPDTGGPTQTVTSNLTTSTSWGPTAADCDVTVVGVIHVGADLTVEPGTKVCFQAEAGLVVDANGSLNAVGSADKTITFTGTSATKGFWKGIAFVSTNNLNKLVYTDIAYAGSSNAFCCAFFNGPEDAHAALVLGDYANGAQVALQHSTIESSGAYGVFAFDSVILDGFSSNTFKSNTRAGVSLTLAEAGKLDSASILGGGENPNGDLWVRVLALSNLTVPTTLQKLDVPYSMGFGYPGNVFHVKSALTLQAGAQLDFEADSGLLVEQDGTLSSSGAVGNHVTLTGRSATKGFWKGVALMSIGNTLAYTDISYGGNSDAFCCSFFEPSSGSPETHANLVVGDYSLAGSATLNNVNVTNSAARGVSLLSLSPLTLQGTNDLLTGNVTANLGI